MSRTHSSGAHYSRALSLLAAGLVCVSSARAQQSPSQATLETARSVVASVTPATQGLAELAAAADAALTHAVRRSLVEGAVSDPSTGSAQGAAQHQLTVVAEKGDVNGRARFYVPMGANTDAQITLTAPLTGGQQATFATGSGLGQNVSVNGSIKVALWSKIQDPATTESAVRTAVANVATAVSTLPENRQLLAGLEMLRRAAASSGDVRPLTTALAAESPRVSRLLASPSLVGDPRLFYTAVAQTLPELVSTRWAAYITPGFETTQHTVAYLDESSLESKTFKDTTTLFSFSGGLSRMAEWRKSDSTEKLLTPLFYAGVSFRGGDSAVVPDSKNVCRPLGSAGGSECLDAPLGTPTASTLMSITAEYRHWALDQSVGLNPRYTYTRQEQDGASDRIIRTFEVPIYFMHQVKDVSVRDVTFGADLAGGVNIGWRDDGTRSGAFVTVFLTKVFGVP